MDGDWSAELPAGGNLGHFPPRSLKSHSIDGATLLLRFLRLEVNFPGPGAGWRQGSGGPCRPCCLLQQAA